MQANHRRASARPTPPGRPEDAATRRRIVSRGRPRRGSADGGTDGRPGRPAVPTCRAPCTFYRALTAPLRRPPDDRLWGRLRSACRPGAARGAVACAGRAARGRPSGARALVGIGCCRRPPPYTTATCTWTATTRSRPMRGVEARWT